MVDHPDSAQHPSAQPMPALSSPESARAHAVLRFAQVAPELHLVRRAVGIHEDRPEHARWVELTEELSPRLQRLLRARAVYRVDEVRQCGPDSLELDSGARYAGDIGKFLADADCVATFVVTIGSALERLARRWLQQGDVMRGTIADAYASEAAEATADQLQREVRVWAQDCGLDVTPRFSPGYCGLDLRQQRMLCASLPTRAIRVSLKPSCLMLPLKSISGLIGVGPADKVQPDAYPCRLCDQPNCPQRRNT